MNIKGLNFGIIAFCLWGMSPLYWGLFTNISAIDVALFRMVGSALFMLFLASIHRRLKETFLITPKTYLILLCTGGLLSLNWTIYVWAMQQNRVLECSLAYFINPIISVFLGRIFLQEFLSAAQKIAVGFATLGVVIIGFDMGTLPWISLSLAISFGIYGLLKKKLDMDPLKAFTAECTILLPFTLLPLLLRDWDGILLPYQPTDWLLVATAGIATAVPLLYYNKSAQLIPLNVIGMLQFMAPTIKFFLGILVFGEVLNLQSALGFSAIWVGVIVFMFPSLKSVRFQASRA